MGFEPTTTTLGKWDSTAELRSHFHSIRLLEEFGWRVKETIDLSADPGSLPLADSHRFIPRKIVDQPFRRGIFPNNEELTK